MRAHFLLLGGLATVAAAAITSPDPQVGSLGCRNLDDGAIIRKVATALYSSPTSSTGDWVGKHATAAAIDWKAIEPCLEGMRLADRSRGEQNHPMRPLKTDKKPEDTASILPRANIWWDDRSDVKGGRVMARIRSRHGYPRLGLISGNNYLLFGGDGPAVMAIVNSGGAWAASTPQAEYKPHGEITVPGYTADPNDPPKPKTPDPQGGLSIAALRCAEHGWKACFVDSNVDQRSRDAAGLGIGFLDQGGGSSQPWVACTKYGCCCGGQQCHGS